MRAPSAELTLYPQLDFPEDPKLRDLPKLFNPHWVWQSYSSRYGIPAVDPERIRIRQFSHSLGRNAHVTYELEWPEEDYIPSECLVGRVLRSKGIELFRYPSDPELPGLSKAASPHTVLELLNGHVFSIPARRAKVQLVRYRPTSRAVLRHTVGRARFYARVVRPATVESLLSAYRVVGQSGFVIPRIVGSWSAGGILWFSEIPGRNLRRNIQSGKLPNPHKLLDGLETLWSIPPENTGVRPFNLLGAYVRAKRSFMHNGIDSDAVMGILKRVTDELDPFVDSWRPSATAHNDFYDDQMLELPNGEIALVDFEEAGPGDPMLDVGNFLAHLRWATSFGSRRRAEWSGEYYGIFERAAIDRFRWDRRDLALREATCLFRICTNAIRRPRGDWLNRLEAGLDLVDKTLG